MKTIITILALGIILTTTGCTSWKQRVPQKAVQNGTTNVVFYWTQRITVPKDVVYRPIPKVSNGDVGTAGLDPAIIGAALETLPKIVEGWNSTKNNVIFSDTELFVSGTSLDGNDIDNMLKQLRPPLDAGR